jgi:hypothetical protein
MPALIWGFILSILVPLTKRILIAAGVGVVTYAGIDTAFGYAKDQVISSYGAMGGDVANIVSLAGFGTAIGIVLGAITARIALIAVSKFVKAAA